MKFITVTPLDFFIHSFFYCCCFTLGPKAPVTFLEEAGNRPKLVAAQVTFTVAQLFLDSLLCLPLCKLFLSFPPEIFVLIFFLFFLTTCLHPSCGSCEWLSIPVHPYTIQFLFAWCNQSFHSFIPMEQPVCLDFLLPTTWTLKKEYQNISPSIMEPSSDYQVDFHRIRAYRTFFVSFCFLWDYFSSMQISRQTKNKTETKVSFGGDMLEQRAYLKIFSTYNGDVCRSMR